MQAIQNTVQDPAAKDSVLRWTQNERTAGSIPVWTSEKTARAAITDQLSTSPKPEAFGFGDLLDMINPLQHIPLVNLAYREITGDSIKPIGKIMGGGIFGGPMGAAGGIMDAIVTHETGGDLADNALSFAQGHRLEKKEDFVVSLLAQKTTPIKAAAQAYERVQFAESRTAGTIPQYA